MLNLRRPFKLSLIKNAGFKWNPAANSYVDQTDHPKLRPFYEGLRGAVQSGAIQNQADLYRHIADFSVANYSSGEVDTGAEVRNMATWLINQGWLLPDAPIETDPTLENLGLRNSDNE